MKSIFLTGTLFLCPLLAQTPEQPPAPVPPKPAPVKTKSAYENLESVWSVSLFYWRPDGKAVLRGGAQSTNPPAQALDYPAKPRQTPGIMLTVPTGHSNRIEVSAWETRGTGSVTASRDETFFGQDFTQGDLLSARYKIRNLKATWNYLSYPYPTLDSRFRVKTLWEVQYVAAYSTVIGPPPDSATPGPVSTGKLTLIMPTFGLGIEWIPSPKHFRFEGRSSGMGLPGKAALWDADALAVARVGNFEIFGGAKAFYFRDSPKKQQFIRDRLWGPMVGVRWVFR